MSDSDKVSVSAGTLASVLSDALVFASADATRPVLRSVQLTAGGGRGQVVATDSYVLGTFTFDAEGTMAALIDVDDVKRILALVKAAKLPSSCPVTLEREGETLAVRELAGQSLTCRLLHGQYEYPRWRELFKPVEGERPDRPALFALGASTTVAKLAKLRLGNEAKRPVAVICESHGLLKPVHLSASSNGIDFRGLAMPIRTYDAEMSAAPEVIAAL